MSILDLATKQRFLANIPSWRNSPMAGGSLGLFVEWVRQQGGQETVRTKVETLSAAPHLFSILCSRSKPLVEPLCHIDWWHVRPRDLGDQSCPKIMCVVGAQKDYSPWQDALKFVTPLQRWKNTCWNEMGLWPLLKVKPRWLYFRVAEARGPFGWTICIFGSISALCQWLSLALSSTLL